MVFETDLNDEHIWKNIATEEHITDLILADCRTAPELLHRIMRERRSLGIRNVIVMHVPVCGSLMSREQKERAAENYRVLREYKGVLFMDDLLEKYEGRLTDIKLIENDYPPGQMRPVPKKDRDTCFAMQRHRR